MPRDPICTDLSEIDRLLTKWLSGHVGPKYRCPVFSKVEMSGLGSSWWGFRGRACGVAGDSGV